MDELNEGQGSKLCQIKNEQIQILQSWFDQSLEKKRSSVEDM